MNPKQKAEQIDRLAEAIGYVATDFERFGALQRTLSRCAA